MNRSLPPSGSLQKPRFPARLNDGLPQTGAIRPAPTTEKTSFSILQATTKNIAVPADSASQKQLNYAQNKPQNTVLAGNLHPARAAMVQKLMAGGISDEAVLSAFSRIERHRFVDPALQAQAYEDTSLPIGLSQTISKPNVVARMLSLLRTGCQLDAQGKMGRVLEIGSGCGYQAALLSLLCSEVYSIERLRGLYEKAIVNVRHLKANNLHLLLGDGMLGDARGAPYAGIIAAAGGEALPQVWVDQLAVGGRLVAPMQQSNGLQGLLVLDKTPNGVEQQVLESVLFVPLKSGVV